MLDQFYDTAPENLISCSLIGDHQKYQLVEDRESGNTVLVVTVRFSVNSEWLSGVAAPVLNAAGNAWSLRDGKISENKALKRGGKSWISGRFL